VNLAWKDVRRQLPRFVATAFGLGLLFAIVLAMGGIYRGMVEDAVLLVDRMGADLWIVQHDTRGPFAERSVVAPSLEARARAVPGVAWSRSFTTTTIQREHAGRPLRTTLVGLAWPDDRGEGLPVIEGRTLARAHDEIVVDRTLGLQIGEHLELGDDVYSVIGITKGMVASGGDPLAFVTNADLLRIQAYLPAEAVRLDRAAGRDGVAAPALVSAVLVRVAPGHDVAEVRGRIASWPDVSVHSTEDQRALLLSGVVDKARRQIGLFRALLVIVSSIVVSLVVFNMTVAKTREIALLKLMGARQRVIVSMIVQQSLLLGLLGYGVAVAVAQLAFERFPRRVVVGAEEYAGVFTVVVTIALVASFAGVRRALSISPTTILAG
jgi:putative ABC transport system permease protein